MGTFKVLVIEDDRIHRRILTKLLKDGFGLDVLEAVDGADGWESVKQNNPDIVFLDLYLPVMNGVEVYEAIRNDARFKTLPVIILSSINDRNVIAKFIAKGVSDYLLKPINPELLNNRMVKLIEQLKADSSETTETSIKEKILIADDDSRFRNFLTLLLQEKFNVSSVDSGLLAFTTFTQQKPEYVIIGEHLSGLNAKLLASKIKNHFSDLKPKIVLSSEKAGFITVSENLFDGVIGRAFEPQKMLDELTSVVFAK